MSQKSGCNIHFNSLLSLSQSLELASKLQINKHTTTNSIHIGILFESASESDSKSNELKISNSMKS